MKYIRLPITLKQTINNNPKTIETNEYKDKIPSANLASR